MAFITEDDVTKAWERYYHSVVMVLPRRGNGVTTAWESYYQSVVITLPKHGNMITRAWRCLFCVTLLLFTTLLTSCNEQQGMLPPSGGKLYEVLLIGDKDNIVRNALMQDTPGLPQSEPFFDVSSIDSTSFGPSVSVARNIVDVHINPQLYTSVRLKYEKNVWAHPQMVVHVNAPSVQMLRDSIGMVTPVLLRLLNRSEIKKNISMLRSKRNIKMEKLVKKMFGINMWIPVEMTSSKKGKNFLWLSNNSPTIMKNIVIYKQPSAGAVPCAGPQLQDAAIQSFCNVRDSVLGTNIKGETDAMQMHTVRETVTKGTVLYRGLWEMTGDDMGGPFVSRVISKDNIIVEGFVFAPGKNKRNAIRQLEATLYTVNYGRQ